jgi:hypothetical protein
MLLEIGQWMLQMLQGFSGTIDRRLSHRTLATMDARKTAILPVECRVALALAVF